MALAPHACALVDKVPGEASRLAIGRSPTLLVDEPASPLPWLRGTEPKYPTFLPTVGLFDNSPTCSTKRPTADGFHQGFDLSPRFLPVFPIPYATSEATGSPHVAAIVQQLWKRHPGCWRQDRDCFLGKIPPTPFKQGGGGFGFSCLERTEAGGI